MTRLVRMASVASALAFLLPLGGCADFDPQDWLDGIISSQKKPLEGDRKPLFPAGTPGVRQGMPPDLVKGYQAPADQPDETAQVPTEATKPKPKAKPKPKVAAAPPANAPRRRVQRPSPRRRKLRLGPMRRRRGSPRHPEGSFGPIRRRSHADGAGRNT